MARAPLAQLHVDTSGIEKLGKAFHDLAIETREKAEIRAVNHTGNKAFTAMARSLSRQVGLRVGEAKSSMNKRMAYAGSPVFRILSKGSHIPAYRFGGRQTRKGASAAPWKTRRVFPGTFVAGMGSGHRGIFVRKSSARLPVKELWGPAFPVEMVKGETKDTFDRLVETELPARFEHELARAVDRVKARYGL